MESGKVFVIQKAAHAARCRPREPRAGLSCGNDCRYRLLFRIIREVAAEPEWEFENVCFEKNDTLTPGAYFDILSSCSSSFELWETVYYHVMPSHEHLIEWVRGTRLRPYLDVLNEGQKVKFEREILSKAREAYPRTASGEVILKFRRFFFTAHK